MGMTTGIEWTDHTWNPWRGCRKVSPGCLNCYMFRDQKRYGKDPTKIVRCSDKVFNAPTKWKDPALVFVPSWSDFFIEDADEWRPAAWEIIRNAEHLTFQILTKRIENVPARLPAGWPFKNVWLGVSVENQSWADNRIPALLKIQAEKLFISAEPLLGPIDFGFGFAGELTRPVDWIIVGGESGPGFRPITESWILGIQHQATIAGIPFFFKQWGGTEKIDGVYGGKELGSRIYQAIPGRGNE